jgi:zinc transporter 1/2/3
MEIYWVTIIKIFSMIAMFLTIVITGLIPIYLYFFYFRDSFKENPKVMSHARAFSGGLFLCVGLLHLLSEVYYLF